MKKKTIFTPLHQNNIVFIKYINRSDKKYDFFKAERLKYIVFCIFKMKKNVLNFGDKHLNLSE